MSGFLTEPMEFWKGFLIGAIAGPCIVGAILYGAWRILQALYGNVSGN